MKLGLIGFVFPESAKSYIFIIFCYNGTYVHLSIQQIGFVLHNHQILIDGVSAEGGQVLFVIRSSWFIVITLRGLRFVKRPRWDSPGEVAKALHGVNFRAPKR